MSGPAAVAAALEQFDFYVQVGQGHNWEVELEKLGVPAETIAEALNSRFLPGLQTNREMAQRSNRRS